MILILFLLYDSGERYIGLIPGPIYRSIWGKTQQNRKAQVGPPKHQNLQEAMTVPQWVTLWLSGLSGSAGRWHLPLLCGSCGRWTWRENHSSSCVCSSVYHGGNSWWSCCCLLRSWDYMSRLVRLTFYSNADPIISHWLSSCTQNDPGPEWSLEHSGYGLS